MQSTMIKIGNFFFKYRNKVFPIIVLALFAIATPPQEIFGSKELEDITDIVAWLLAFAGLGMRALVIGFAYIKRGGLDKKVYAENLVTDGIFGICRNPLYVGNILICMAVFLMHGDLLVMLVGIGFYMFVYQCIVLAEEAYLADKFGPGFTAYCQDVPRWIPNFAKFKESTAGMKFDWKKALWKDYTTIATALIALTCTQIYEYMAQPGATINSDEMLGMFAALLCIGIAVGVIRYLKKRPIAAPVV